MAESECTPEKCARRDIGDDVTYVSPANAARSSTQQNLAVLEHVGIDSTTDVGELKHLLEACREIVVSKVDNEEKVPPELRFMSPAGSCAAKTILRVLGQLLQVAGVTTVKLVRLTGRGKIGSENRVVFFKSVAARALDMLVLRHTNSSGMVDDPAGAVFIAGYQKSAPDPAHVVAWLKKQTQWVFGDYCAPLKKEARRLLQRHTHRAMILLMEPGWEVRCPAKEVARWRQLRLKEKKWVTSGRKFEALVNLLITRTNLPLQNENENEDEENESDDEGVTGQRDPSSSDCVTGCDEKDDDDGDLSFTESWDATTVASFLEKEVEGFDSIASRWRWSQQEVQDLTADALRRQVGEVCDSLALTEDIMMELSKLRAKSTNAKKGKRKATSSSFASAPSRRRAAVVMENLDGAAYLAVRDEKFGADEQVSAEEIRKKMRRATLWAGSKVFYLESGHERFGQIVAPLSPSESGSSSASSNTPTFSVAVDGGDEMKVMSLEEAAIALHAMRELRTTMPKSFEATGTDQAVRAAKARKGAKAAIGDKALKQAVVERALDGAYEQMKQHGSFDGIGMGKGSYLSGAAALEILEMLREGGKAAVRVKGHRAFLHVEQECKRILGKSGVQLSRTQFVESAWPSGGRDSLLSLTCFLVSDKPRGITKKPDQRQKVLVWTDDGTALKQEDAEDCSGKDLSNFGVTKLVLRRLFDVVKLVHGQALGRKWEADLSDLMEDLSTSTGRRGSMDALDTLLTSVWSELPGKFWDAAAASAEGGTPLSAEAVKLDWEPRNWAVDKQDVILSAGMDKMEALTDRLTNEMAKVSQLRDQLGKGNGNKNARRAADDGGGTPYVPPANKKVPGNKKRKADGAAPVAAGKPKKPKPVVVDKSAGWDRFDPGVKKWCDEHDFETVYAARIAWVAKNKAQCFWTNSDLGRLMGAKCHKGATCFFADTHPS